MDITVNNNHLNIDMEKDFLAPLRGGIYTGMNDGAGPDVGIGKTLEGMVRLEANMGDETLLGARNWLSSN